MGGITFNSDAASYTLGGSSITLSGAINDLSTKLQTLNFDIAMSGSPTINLPNGGSMTITGVISGAGALTVNAVSSGAGTLTLTGTNTFSGTLAKSGSGTLAISGSIGIGGG